MYTYKHMCAHAFHMYILYCYKVGEQGLGGYQMCMDVRGQLAELCSLCHVSSRTKYKSSGLVTAALPMESFLCPHQSCIYLFSDLCLSQSCADFPDKVYFSPWKKNLSADHECVGRNAGVHHGCVFCTLIKHFGVVKIKTISKLLLPKESLTASY